MTAVNPLVEINLGEVQRLIYDRLSRAPEFRALIAVSIEKYPEELFATAWVGGEPTDEMRRLARDVEADLVVRGTACTILLKSERSLPHGGRYRLKTIAGDVEYRTYRIDPIGDEDWVFLISVARGDETLRFRLSLTRTLTTMLRVRQALDENKILDVYVQEVSRRIDQGHVPPEVLNEVMFGSRDLSRFLGD